MYSDIFKLILILLSVAVGQVINTVLRWIDNVLKVLGLVSEANGVVV